jgi:putrescine---pyruvate transaminase
VAWPGGASRVGPAIGSLSGSLPDAFEAGGLCRIDPLKPFAGPILCAADWRRGYTYSGHASAAAAAHANLDIIEREGLVARGLELETEIADAIAPLAGHELVSEIRSGFGSVAAIQVDPALLADDPGLTDRITLRARSHGVLTRTLTGGGLQISPPLVITRSELDEVASGIRGALDDIAAAA